MNTKIFDVRSIADDHGALKTELREAADILSSGGTVAFPTETVYGLGADALNESAVRKIYEAKGRPSDNPLIVHIADTAQLEGLVQEIPEKAQKLMNAFWPGPVSIIMKKLPCIPDCVTAGLDTVGIRMPENAEAAELLKMSGVPVAAPSANLSGKPSPTRPEHVLHDLQGRVDGIILGRDCEVGIESTVINLSCDPPVILRPGIITKDDIEAVIGLVDQAGRKLPGTIAEISPAAAQAAESGKAPQGSDSQPEPDSQDNIPRAPGMKYTHYAPDAPMILFEGEPADIVRRIIEQAGEELDKGRKLGIIGADNTVMGYRYFLGEDSDRLHIVSAGDRGDLRSVAHNIFDILRSFDLLGVDLILAEAFEAEGVGFSVMNRMDKAAREIR